MASKPRGGQGARTARPSTRPPSRSDIPLDTGLDAGEEATLFDRSPADSYCLVWRRHAVTKKLGLLDRLSPSEATEERVSELYGGGEYVVREKVPGPNGGFVWGRQASFTIEGRPREKAVVVQTHGVDDLGGGGGGVSAGTQDVITAGILDFLKMSREQARDAAEANRETLRMMMETRSQKPAIDTVALITAIGSIVGPIITEMVKGRRDDGKQFENLLRMLEATRQTSSPMAALRENIGAMSDMLGLKAEFGNLGGGKDDDDDKLLALVADAIPKLLARRAESEAPAKPSERPALPAPAPSTPPAQDAPTMKPWQVALKPYRGMLVAMAKQGKDADNIVTGLMEFVSQQTREIITVFLGEPDCLDQFYDFIPEMKQYPTWTEEFLTAVAEQLGLVPDGDEEQRDLDDDATDDDAPPAPGGVPTSQNN